MTAALGVAVSPRQTGADSTFWLGKESGRHAFLCSVYLVRVTGRAEDFQTGLSVSLPCLPGPVIIPQPCCLSAGPPDGQQHNLLSDLKGRSHVHLPCFKVSGFSASGNLLLLPGLCYPPLPIPALSLLGKGNLSASCIPVSILNCLIYKTYISV